MPKEQTAEPNRILYFTAAVIKFDKTLKTVVFFLQ